MRKTAPGRNEPIRILHRAAWEVHCHRSHECALRRVRPGETNPSRASSAASERTHFDRVPIGQIRICGPAGRVRASASRALRLQNEPIQVSNDRLIDRSNSCKKTAASALRSGAATGTRNPIFAGAKGALPVGLFARRGIWNRALEPLF